MAVNNGQTSYDPRFIRDLFPKSDTYQNSALADLFDVDLTKLDDLPPEKYKLFEENHERATADGIQTISRTEIKPYKQYVIEEKLRPGEFIPIEEDSFGTHIMSSRDLCTADFLADIIATGINSLKVEGRNKSVYYAAIVAKIYRKIIDELYEGKEPSIEEAMKELHSTGNRGFTPDQWLLPVWQAETRRMDQNNQTLVSCTAVHSLTSPRILNSGSIPGSCPRNLR